MGHRSGFVGSLPLCLARRGRGLVHFLALPSQRGGGLVHWAFALPCGVGDYYILVRYLVRARRGKEREPGNKTVRRHIGN